MRILLGCLPAELAIELYGHEVSTVQQAGWAGLKNGELLERASDHFEILLTIDKRVEREYKLPINLALVTVRARSNRIQDLLPLVPELLRAVNEAKGGASTTVGN